MDLKDLGERKIIKTLMDLYGTIVEDDAFYFESGGKYILITTDSISRKTHIPEGVDPKKAGYFFAALNLSDIAAMGGIPQFFMTSYSMKSETNFDFFVNFNKGIKECLDKYEVKMVGGDTKEGMDFVATGIVIGKVEKERILKRNNVKNGDVVAVTNFLGKNSAGYYLWKNGYKEGANILLEIEPRINEARELSYLGVRSAMDLSDGIFSIVHQLKNQTGLGFKIYYEKLPKHPLALKVMDELKVPGEEILLNFGGEYEIFFTVDKKIWKSVESGMKQKGYMVTEIGEVWEGENILIKEGKGARIDKYGYEHFTRG